MPNTRTAERQTPKALSTFDASAKGNPGVENEPRSRGEMVGRSRIIQLNAQNIAFARARHHKLDNLMDEEIRTMLIRSQIEVQHQQRQQQQEKQEPLTVRLGNPLPDLKAHAHLYVPNPHDETDSLLEFSFKRTIRVVRSSTSSSTSTFPILHQILTRTLNSHTRRQATPSHPI
jgi:hypothetical protein